MIIFFRHDCQDGSDENDCLFGNHAIWCLVLLVLFLKFLFLYFVFGVWHGIFGVFGILDGVLEDQSL